MLQDYCQIIQHYFLQILFKSVEISCFITKHVGLQFFFLGTVRVLSNFWVIVSVLCRPNVNIQSIWQNYASQHSSRDEATALCTAIIKLHYSLFVVTEAFSSCDTERCTNDDQRQNYNDQTPTCCYRGRIPLFYPAVNLVENLVASKSKACQKPAPNLFKTVFLHSICLARAQTSEPAAVRDQVFDKKVESWSKTCRKPARTCRKPGCKPGRKPGLQLARIMECGLKSAVLCIYRNARTQTYSAFIMIVI